MKREMTSPSGRQGSAFQRRARQQASAPDVQKQSVLRRQRFVGLTLLADPEESCVPRAEAAPWHLLLVRMDKKSRLVGGLRSLAVS